MLDAVLRPFARVSERALFLVLLALPILPIVILSIFTLDEAEKRDRQAFSQFQISFIHRFELGGAPTVMYDIELMRQSKQIDPSDAWYEAAIWNLGTGEAVLEAASDDLLADPRLVSKDADLEGYDLAWVIPDEIQENSGFSEKEVIVLAAIQPGPATSDARRLVAGIAAAYLFTVLATALLQLHHRLRYRDGLSRMSHTLARFASGETAIRLDERPPAPELGTLALQINPVLSRLQNQLDDLRDAAAAVAHEMKTPIQHAKIELGRLWANQPDEETGAALDRLERQIYAGLSGIDAVMTLFAIEAQIDQPLPAQVDLSDRLELAVDRSVDLLIRGETPPHISLDDTVRVAGDAHQLDSMVFNLIENAGKHAPSDAEISISLERKHDRFKLSVLNSGGGFPEDVRDLAFQRFARSGRARSKSGLGIGLSLVAAVARRHGFTASITPSSEFAEVVIEGACIVASDD